MTLVLEVVAKAEQKDALVSSPASMVMPSSAIRFLIERRHMAPGVTFQMQSERQLEKYM